MGDLGAPLVAAAAHALAAGVAARTVVLVEGVSDQFALEALAARRGRDLAAEGIAVMPTGGATTIGRFLTQLGPQGSDIRLAGMYDAAEEDGVRRRLERAGLGANLTRVDMEALGFFVCVADLEDELIRALGAAAVEQVLDADERRARALHHAPAHRGESRTAQLHRFMGTRSGRKIRYGRLLVDALDLTRVPRPLDLLLAHLASVDGPAA